MKNEELDITKLRALYEATTEPGNRWISAARRDDVEFIAAIRNATPALLDAAERCLTETARADEAEKNYRFMVERAADQKLDGYRELGARAAAAENGRDDLVRRLAAADERIAILVEANDALTEMARESNDVASRAADCVAVAEQALTKIASITTFTLRSAQEIAEAALATMKAMP